jgi:hypothetical protein
MILANVRTRLTRDDAQLVLRLVARGSETAYAAAEEVLRAEGLDALLDDPRLPAALLEARQAAHASLQLFTYVIVRHAMRQVEEDDRGISDYVASVLVHFAMHDNAHRVSPVDDERYDTMAGLIADADRGDTTRRFLVSAHLGNYALWLGGLFPDHVEERRWRRGGRTSTTTTRWGSEASASLRSTAWRASTAWRLCSPRRRSGSPGSEWA